MVNESVLGVIEKWELTGELDLVMAQVVERHFDDLMEHELSQIGDLVEAQPYVAFSRLARLISFLNAVAVRFPSIIRRLENWVQLLKAAANAVAKKLGANEFSISAGLPVGISIDFSFPVA